ncbi:hypothetical protein K8I61_04230 [bacterium]|nr:hypothetical protein [bacterium]
MLAKRLKTVRDEAFGGSNLAMARAIGVSEGAVRGWLRGDHEPGAPAVEAIRRAAGYRADWLLSGVGPRHERAAEGAGEMRIVAPKDAWFRGVRERIDAYYPVPLVTGEVAAGAPRAISESEVDDWVPTIYHREWCPHPERTVCVRVAGDSMIPTIPDGGLVAIDLAQTDPKRLARMIVALRRDDGVTIKRLFATDSGQWVARPDNGDSNELYVFAPDEIADAIVGKVVWWWGRQ